MEIRISPHSLEYRVIYGDTDQMGVVYHANYLRFFEASRTEYLRVRGFTYREVEEGGFMMPVAEAALKYHSPARYDDLILVETLPDPKVRVGFRFNYRIFRKETEELLVSGHTLHACMEASTGRVIRPPKDMVAKVFLDMPFIKAL
ncbi:MAG: acyl-CoA thioesterase [Deltaproteobacteria bacterium]|nr:acyl-CoA thioesterase [Deltaproteobacteria bacterium]